MRIAYFDCFAGISGDMALGALLDAGADLEALVAGLRSLALPDWELRARKVAPDGIAATDVEILVGGEPAGDAPAIDAAATHPARHDHDHGHHYSRVNGEPGREHNPDDLHRHDPAPERPGAGSAASDRSDVSDASDESNPSAHGRDHSHHAAERHHGPHTHPHHGHTRTLAQIRALIRGSALPEVVRERGEKVFTRLAEAEAHVHHSTAEAIHFHEVGAVDSVVDVVGTVYALHLLGVERVTASPVPSGHGFIRAAHGLLPVPAPATAELLKGVPLRSVDVEGELVTPTGAALLAALCEEFGPMPSMRPHAVGYGSGKRRFAFPNLLRVTIGEAEGALAEATEVALLEANIDDMSPQLYEHVMERLLEAGALDVYLQPILMKKGRPAQILSVLCEPLCAPALARLILRETTTLGLRESRQHRYCLQREFRVVSTPYGEIRVKVGRLEGEAVTLAPEYAECRRAADVAGVPLKEVQAAALCAARAELPGPHR